MPQSLSNVVVHVVYSTKNRRPWLREVELRDGLFAYMATVLTNEVESSAILIGGVEDHVHILCRLSRKYALMDVVKVSKTETTKWMKKQGPELQDFHWQNGYGAFSVSASNVEQVKRYIARQEEHHKRMTFQEEFRAICRRHGVEIDERYVWD